ncbi:hypothetical protein Psal006b_00943 [Piscirickettsia salmonis]|uniref:Membrane protein n=1 Tax=Piscirickettsia salmonis TaxID=1238 RepID=A0A1L6TDE1_PISSA|nr:hypothetical protein [Piscirickettsia salmonis]AKP74472.2 hypothetical protein PSLF89_2926 [Piscirickettsia salmonis LF-89 = ATCC VR-1361]ALB23440.1 membrane protein [Piscirickettsia salmonis]ALY03319.1 hypothetical protein AWE47_11080 [Piscirickettsia salmonis]AMA42885.1 hypothetical protein AWJ11_11310 [Piscirickettsia salmonis]AOS35353.1 hypothetical protein AVM72_08435 [Piscirickettsia salmonis]
MPDSSELDCIYSDLRSENERYYYQRFLNGFGQFADSTYLYESSLKYFEDTTGEQLAFTSDATSYSALGSFALFGILGTLTAHSQFHRNKKVDDYYRKFREVLSAAKNGRHAVINISNLIATFSHQAIAVSIFSPAGGIGFAVGILLIANNLYKLHLEEKRNNNVRLIKQYLINQYGQDFKSILPPSFKNNRKLVFTNVIDGLTDGLYVAGNIFMLLGLFGLVTSLPPVAISMCVIYGIYTLGSIIVKFFKEKESQLQEELIYLKFLNKLDSEDKLIGYHNHFKNDSSYKRYIGKLIDVDGSKDIESLKNKLREALEKKEYQLNIKKEKLNNNIIYKLYKIISKPFLIIRDYINIIKNSFATAVGIDVLISHSSLANAAVSFACIVAGLVLALPFVAYKTYQLIRPRYQLKERKDLGCLDLFSFFKEYSQPGFFKKRNHIEAVKNLINKYEGHKENYLNIFFEVKNYINSNINNINLSGDLYLRYKAAKIYITHKHENLFPAVLQIQKEFNDLSPKGNKEIIKRVKFLLELYPSATKKELVRSLASFNLEVQIEIIKNIPEFIDNGLMIIFKSLLDKIDSLKSRKEFFNYILLEYLDDGVFNKNKFEALIGDINKLLSAQFLYPIDSSYVNFYMNKAALNYLKGYANDLLKDNFLTICEKLERYKNKHDEIVKLQPKMMSYYAGRRKNDSLAVSIAEFKQFMQQEKNSQDIRSSTLFYSSQANKQFSSSLNFSLSGI